MGLFSAVSRSQAQSLTFIPKFIPGATKADPVRKETAVFAACWHNSGNIDLKVPFNKTVADQILHMNSFEYWKTVKMIPVVKGLNNSFVAVQADDGKSL